MTADNFNPLAAKYRARINAVQKLIYDRLGATITQAHGYIRGQSRTNVILSVAYGGSERKFDFSAEFIGDRQGRDCADYIGNWLAGVKKERRG